MLSVLCELCVDRRVGRYENCGVHQTGSRRATGNRVSTRPGRGFASRTPSFEMNEPDAYALEESLRLKEKHGGEVVVCSAGPARVVQVLREALARGADRAIHVEATRWARRTRVSWPVRSRVR